ncbi:helix-turn-helix domain-containing protein [Cyanobium sp. Copco_Reservoir_LC18]|uniref:helix-turn-helix domain-containing protein n=1 Tax=Cyanobium sp. Copco_Reservoir_LC18 TaxID=1328305 RepID=UPI001358E24A
MPFTLTTAEAAELLRVSDVTLRRLRKSGVLKAGVHFRVQGLGTVRPPLLWNKDAVDAELAKRSRRVLGRSC